MFGNFWKLFSAWDVSYSMNLRTALTTTAALIALTSIVHADSKRTAEYYLSDPLNHQNKEVTLDVSFVKPVHWVSPFAGVAFFRAMTTDRTDRKRGGGILVAVPATEAAKFAKKYGTDFDGRTDKTTLRGDFIAGGGTKNRKMWMLDTTGKLTEIMAAQKKNFPDEAFEDGTGPGPKGPRGFGKRSGGIR